MSDCEHYVKLLTALSVCATGTQSRGFEMNKWSTKRQGRAVATALIATLMMAAAAIASTGLSGKVAPNFSLKNSAGEDVSLTDLRGDVVMINFWATWCGPCREEMPLLDEMHSRYNRVGFSLLGVNIDDDPRRAEEMIESLGVTFPVVFDNTKKVSQQYDVNAMPVTILLDREGVVRHVHYGYKPGYEDKYLEQIRELLRE
ncbi:MAG: TlpA disulfide reductase family protein [Pseudomonadota bacterium]